MGTIFSIDSHTLDNLSAKSATKVFRDLLWCEVLRIGISPHKVVISLRTDVPDGGIDARVDGNPALDSFLVKGFSYFQLKAGQTFKPWQMGALKKELFGNPKAVPAKEALAPQIRECLKKKGRYVLVSFGNDLTPQQQSISIKMLKKLIIACGCRKPVVDVIGQGQLLGLLSMFPSLSLELQGKGNFVFLTVDEWKTRADMVQTLQLSTVQERVIEQIQEGLLGTQYKHIRLIGEPGLGKTRLVLEAVTVEDLAPMIIYVPHAEDFQRSLLFNELLRKDATKTAILVVDECSERERASIWTSLREKQGIKLVTIDHGPERSRDEAMLVIDLPRLPDDKIRAILASYLPEGCNPSHWVEWCEGSPRVAHAVGENLKINPEDLLKPPATVPIWERFIIGYERYDSKNAQETLTVLRHLALFTKFGFEDPVSDEAQFIWQIIQHADPAITWARFQEIVDRLRQKRILQGKRTLFIVPKALHIHLWIDYWNVYGRNFFFSDFFAGVPSQLRHWFLQFFIYGHQSPVACDVIAKILSRTGPFDDRAFLVSKAGTRFINYLAEADPANTLALLERTFGSWTEEELLAFKDERQNIVWALEKIAVWKEHFYRSARLLIKFAIAENSNFSNNSTGTLQSLFWSGPGWAATQASPAERFPLIQELLESDNERELSLGLDLCKAWLNTRGGIRIVGAEYQGLRPQLEFWKPRLWAEVFDALRLCWRYLYSVSRDWKYDKRKKANSVLIEEGFQLIHYRAVAPEIMATMFELADDEATDRKLFTHRLISELRFRKEGLPKGMSGKLRSLDKKLTGISFWERFSRFVLNTNWDEDFHTKRSEVKMLSTSSKRVEKLVEEVVSQPSLLTEHLPKIVMAEGHRLFEFGRGLSLRLDDGTVLKQIIDAQMKADLTKNTQFIGGYFNGYREKNAAEWEKCVQSLLISEASKDLGVAVVYWAGMSETILNILLDMYRKNTVTAAVFNRLACNADREGLSREIMEDVLRSLVTMRKNEALVVAIELAHFYFFNDTQPKSCDERLLFDLLTKEYFYSRDQETMVGYNWHEVAEGFLKRFPDRDLELLKVILSRVDNLSSLRMSSYPSRLADKVVQAHPAEAWEIISSIIETDKETGYWLYVWLGDEFSFEDDEHTGLIASFDAESIIQWVKEDAVERVWQICKCLPKTLDEAKGGKLTKLFIEEFGDSEEIANSLLSHFWTGGWSGPESKYLSRKRDRARQWISEIKSGKVLAWLYRYIEILNRRISHAEMEEERQF
jgi:hypothetical protein